MPFGILQRPDEKLGAPVGGREQIAVACFRRPPPAEYIRRIAHLQAEALVMINRPVERAGWPRRCPGRRNDHCQQ